MNTLTTERVSAVLDRLYKDEQEKDPPAIAKHLAQQRRLVEYSHEELNDLYAEAYIPVDRVSGDLLYLMARVKQATRVVEFGTSFGISTIFLAAAVQDNGGGLVVGSEFMPAKAAVAEANLADAGLADLVDVRVGDARETLASVDGPIDLLLLDGWKDLYLPILRLLESKLAPQALVVADDIAVVPEIHASYLAHVRDGVGYHSVQVPVGDGMEFSTWLGE